MRLSNRKIHALPEHLAAQKYSPKTVSHPVKNAANCFLYFPPFFSSICRHIFLRLAAIFFDRHLPKVDGAIFFNCLHHFALISDEPVCKPGRRCACQCALICCVCATVCGQADLLSAARARCRVPGRSPCYSSAISRT